MTARLWILWLLATACLDAPPEGTAPSDPDARTAGDATAGDPTLLAAFRFEPGAFLADSSGYGHDAECTGVVCPSPVPDRTGDGQAARFDGVDDKLAVETLGSGPFTVMAWLRLDAEPLSVACPLNKPYGVAGEDTWQLCLEVPEKGIAQLVFYTSDGSDEVAVDLAMDLATWHHVAIRWDLDQKTITWDGVDVMSGPGTTVYDEDHISIGSDIDLLEPVAFFPGTLDDVRIHDRALSEEAIGAAAGL